MRPVVLFAAMIALTACAIIPPPQPTTTEIRRVTEAAIQYAIQAIPGGFASYRIGNVVAEARVVHTFYDGMASYILRSNPCHSLRVKIQDAEQYYTACEVGGGHYNVALGEHSFDAIEKIRSGKVPLIFQY